MSEIYFKYVLHKYIVTGKIKCFRVYTVYHPKLSRQLFENEDVIETWTVSADIEQEIQLQAWLDKQLGKKYDYLPALALGFLRQNWMNNDDKWFCSELIDAAFKQAGIPLTNQDYMPYRLTPNDLRPSNRLRYLSLEKSTSKPFWQKLVRFFV